MATRIPRRAARVWLQGVDRMPPHLRELCATFDELHPAWATEWYDHERIMDEVDLREARDLYVHAERYVPADSVAQMRADIARYAILRQRGGVTLDCDYRWHRPIDDLLTDASVVLAWERTGQWIACGFMASRAGHTLFTKVLAGLPGRAREIAGRGLRANAFTGPKYLTPIVSALLPRKDVRLLDDHLLHAIGWDQWRTAGAGAPDPDAYGTHLWAHQRGLAGADGGIWRTW